MDATALYTIRQYGKDTHFYSYCAGGYSYPFHTAEWLTRLDTDINQHRQAEEKLSVAALLPQMTGNYNFPEAAYALRMFRFINESAAADFVQRTAVGERIPFHITIDLDKQTIGFVFNHSFPELDLMDLELPIQGILGEFGGKALHEAACEQAKQLCAHNSPFMAEFNEKVYEQHIREYAENQLSQGGMGMAMR